MRALRLERTGSLDALSIQDIAAPRADEDHVVVAVRAAGINPSDAKNALGAFSDTRLPITPGRDFAGVIAAGPAEMVGRHVWGTGRELGFTVDGAHAAELRLPLAAVRELPAGLDFARAAAVPVPFITAWLTLSEASLRPDDSVIVTGAAGAVGSATVQLARWRGARVIGLVRKESQLATVRAHGAHEALDISATDPSDVIATLGGADIVVDSAGLPELDRMVGWLRPRGRLVVITATRPLTLDVKALYRKEARLVGVNSLAHDSVASARLLESIGSGFAAGALTVPAPLSCPLDDARAAYERALSGASKQVFTFP